jgi:hypothetical protein
VKPLFLRYQTKLINLLTMPLMRLMSCLPHGWKLQRQRYTLAASTVQQYCARFYNSLREILNLQPQSIEGQWLLKRYQTICAHLLLFLTDETIPSTHNSSEQVLRWSFVFRK